MLAASYDSHGARQRRWYPRIARLGAMQFAMYVILLYLRSERSLDCLSITAKDARSMIGCYLLYARTVLAQPSGDFADSVLRRAEARRKLSGRKRLELRKLRILLLRTSSSGAAFCARSGRNSRIVFPREAHIHRLCARRMRERRMNIATRRYHAAFGDSFP